tara:strand:+ start:1447 stop:1728 length:282 start_codon:yes stop_codon:yes gene_type:complete
MGPHYDNNTGRYIKYEEVFNAHWLVDNETDALYLLPRDGDGFDTYGMDEEVEERLNTFSDEQLADYDFMEEQGFTVIPDHQRRFDEATGYFVA